MVKDSEEPNVTDENGDSVKEETCNSDSIESIICVVFEFFYVQVKCNDKELYLYSIGDLTALLNEGQYIEVLKLCKRCEGEKVDSVYDNIDYDNEIDDKYNAELEEQTEDYAILNECYSEDACNYNDDERDDDFNECDNEDVCNYYDDLREDDFNEYDDEDACDYYDERDDDFNEYDNEDACDYYDERDDDFNECDNEDVCDYYDEERDDVDFTESDDEDYNDFYDNYDDERDYSYSDAESEPYDFEQYDADAYLEMLDEYDELYSDDADRDNFYSDSKLATYKYYLAVFVEYLLSKNPASKQKFLSVNPAVNHEDELIAYHGGKGNSSDELVFSKAGTNQKIIKNKNARDCQNFIVLFKSAVKGLMLDYCLNENTIKLALEDMKESYRNVQNGTIQTEIDFNNLNYIVGYLKRFALCHAAMVQEVILNILEAPPHELSSKLVRNRKVNLVCLGSGPGNDLVGFLSAFHCHFMKLTDLDITVVDRMSGWQVAFSRIIQLLKNESHGNLSVLFREGPNVTTSFIAEDLTG